jgi:outer membrane usher protein FimD/PapC
MSTKRIEVIRKRSGETKILIDNKDIKNVSEYSAGQLIAAGALLCLTGSFPDELTKLNPSAKYGEIRSYASYKFAKFDEARYSVDSMNLNLELEIPDEFLREHEIVAKMHEERGCLWTRSLKKGIKINYNFSRLTN